MQITVVCVEKTNSVGAITTSHSQNKRGGPLFFFPLIFYYMGNENNDKSETDEHEKD